MRSVPLRPLLALSGLLVAAATAGAATPPREASDAYDDGEPRLTARLLVAPRGDDLWRVGVELVPAPGWHVYWRNPGDTGLAPRVEWRLAGADFGELAWPAPRAFSDPQAELVSYGYDEPVLLATTARVPRSAGPLGARVDAVVCAHLCIPAEFELGAPLAPASAADAARFDAAARRIPVGAAERGVGVVLDALPASGPADVLRARVAVFPCSDSPDAACPVGSAAGAGPGLLPYASPDVHWIASAPRPHPDVASAFTIDLTGTWLGSGAPGDWPLAGVVPLRAVDGAERSVEVSIVASPAARAAGGGAAWLRAALLGFVGGLILNLMPCVLPVLALKLTSLAALAHSSRREQWRHVTAYTAGIGLSMLGLAGGVLGLRAAGTAVGWGFQLQEPVFLVAISCLLVAFALNLFGTFEIHVDTGRLAGVGRDTPGAARSFFDGLLAVALATPCSAPFLGTAVGFAFASSAPVILSVFGAIGLGLAAPFGLAALFPGWTRRLPRSGAWMADLRSVLGFALLASVVWLLWILGRVRGAEAITGTLALLLAVAAAAWALGQLQRRKRALPASLCALVLGGVTLGGIGVVDLAPVRAGAVSAPVIPAALPFAAGAVDASLDAGRPVFVYFTADWCVTCKVNEKRVLSDRQVAVELERLGYDVYRADWTRRDERVRAGLAALGKAGVPAYALYDPATPDAPRVLPELLTRHGLLEALRQTAGEPAPRS